MNKRFISVVVASALGALALVSSPLSGPAQATVSPSATRAGAWLAEQLTGGLIHNDQFSFDDYGLTLDVLMALQEADTRGPKQDAIVSAMWDNIKNYIYDSPNTAPGDGVFAGSAAKALVAVQAAGKNGNRFGGVDLVSTVEGTVEPGGSDKGRLKDRDIAGYPDPAVLADYSNLLYQAYGLEGLAEATSAKVDDVRDFLLKQQCQAGYFRLYFDACKPDTDATAIAIRAMSAAKADGVTGMDAALARATKWLLDQQRSDGSFVGGASTPGPNANSTGLAASALALRGKTGAAQHAAAWVYELQVKSSTGGKLASEDGAVALAKDGWNAGRADGITAATADQWRRATAQAIYGLIHLDPATIDVRVVERIVTKVPKPLVRTVNIRNSVVAGDGAQVPKGADSPAGKLGHYLAGRFSDADHIEVKDGGDTFVDYDLTAGTVLALRQLGQQPAIAERGSNFLFDGDSIDAYAHGAPYEKKASYAEPLAKLLIVGTLTKKTDAKTLKSLAAELTGLQQADGSFKDNGEYTDQSGNTTRQAIVALALRMAGDATAADKAVLYIEKHQCKDGGFPRSLSSDCATGDPASTGWALQALNAASADGRTGSQTLADVPTSWDQDRSAVMVNAATSLRAVVHVDGSVRNANIGDTSAVAAGLQAAGTDMRATSLFVTTLQKKDGGLPANTVDKGSVNKGSVNKGSDLLSSVASAPAVARSSWLSTPRTGLAAAVSLPLDREYAVRSIGNTSKAGGFVVARPVAYAGGGLLGLLMLAAIGFGLTRLNRSGSFS